MVYNAREEQNDPTTEEDHGAPCGASHSEAFSSIRVLPKDVEGPDRCHVLPPPELIEDENESPSVLPVIPPLPQATDNIINVPSNLSFDYLDPPNPDISTVPLPGSDPRPNTVPPRKRLRTFAEIRALSGRPRLESVLNSLPNPLSKSGEALGGEQELIDGTDCQRQALSVHLRSHRDRGSSANDPTNRPESHYQGSARKIPMDATGAWLGLPSDLLQSHPDHTISPPCLAKIGRSRPAVDANRIPPRSWELISDPLGQLSSIKITNPACRGVRIDYSSQTVATRDVENWLVAPGAAPVFWASGSAATTTATSMCQSLEAAGHSNGNVLLLRYAGHGDHVREYTAALAQQLGRLRPGLLDRIHDSLIQCSHPAANEGAFITRKVPDTTIGASYAPLEHPIVLVFDALNESGEAEATGQDILDVIHSLELALVDQPSWLKLVFISRPEVTQSAALRASQAAEHGNKSTDRLPMESPPAQQGPLTGVPTGLLTSPSRSATTPPVGASSREDGGPTALANCFMCGRYMCGRYSGATPKYLENATQERGAPQFRCVEGLTLCNRI